MASKGILKTNNGLGEYLITFLVDNIVDIDDLSTDVAIGSTVICIENKKKYVLSTTRVWTIQ